MFNQIKNGFKERNTAMYQLLLLRVVIVFLTLCFYDYILTFYLGIEYTFYRLFFSMLYSILFANLTLKVRNSTLSKILFFCIGLLLALLHFAQSSFVTVFYYFATTYDLSKTSELIQLGNALKSYLDVKLLSMFIPLLFFAAPFFYEQRFQVEKTKKFKNSFVTFFSVTSLFFLSLSLASLDNNKLFLSDSTSFVERYGVLDMAVVDVINQILPKKTVNLHAEDYPFIFYPETTNTMTGKYEGKNLIFINGESIAPYAIDEVLTPNLYKLKTEGYYFSNFYAPSINTAYSEYTYLNSFYGSNNWSGGFLNKNSMPLAFKEKDYDTHYFHNFYENIYDRERRNTEFGFDNSFGSEKLGIVATDWVNLPSDVDLFVNAFPYYASKYIAETVDDVEGVKFNNELEIELNTMFESQLNTEMEHADVVEMSTINDNESNDDNIDSSNMQENINPFFTYFMTVTSHAPFDYKERPLLETKIEPVKERFPNYPIEIQSYFAATMVLDEGIGVLFNQLEQNGLLDNTVIVFVGDHHPYALDVNQIEALFGVDDGLDSYKVPFIIWDNTKPSEEIDHILGSVDVYPTLANLFNLNIGYSVGKDIFSSSKDEIVVEWFNTRQYSFICADGTGYDGRHKRIIGNLTDKELQALKNRTLNREKINLSSLEVKREQVSTF